MSLVGLLAKVYIMILILRWVLTQQELFYNPTGRLVQKATGPLFKAAAGSKAETDKLVPVYITLVILLYSILNGLSKGNIFVGLVDGFSSMLRFLSVFFIISLLMGSVITPGSSFFPTLFHRLGGVWVKPARKIIPVRGNIVVIPAIILILLTFIGLDIGIKAIARLAANVPISITLLTNSLFWFAHSITSILNLFMIVLIIRAVMSWFSPDPRNQLVQFMYYATEPFLNPIRKRIPPIAGLDFSVLILIILIGVLQSLIYSVLPGNLPLI